MAATTPESPPIRSPRALHRLDRTWKWLVVAAGVLVAVAATAAFWFIWPRWMQLSVLFQVPALLVVFVGMRLIRARRGAIIRLAGESDGLLCIDCLYPLNPDADRCPECGLAISAREAREIWMEHLDV